MVARPSDLGRILWPCEKTDDEVLAEVRENLSLSLDQRLAKADRARRKSRALWLFPGRPRDLCETRKREEDTESLRYLLAIKEVRKQLGHRV